MSFNKILQEVLKAAGDNAIEQENPDGTKIRMGAQAIPAACIKCGNHGPVIVPVLKGETPYVLLGDKVHASGGVPCLCPKCYEEATDEEVEQFENVVADQIESMAPGDVGVSVDIRELNQQRKEKEFERKQHVHVNNSKLIH